MSHISNIPNQNAMSGIIETKFGYIINSHYLYFLDYTHIFSTGHIGLSLSTVSWMSERPTPITSMNCFGKSGLDMDQKRLPMPPAMMIICISVQCIKTDFCNQ